MATQEDVFSLIHASRQVRRSPMVRVELLHQRAMRMNDCLALSSFLKPKNFIGLFFGHRSIARATARSAAGRVSVSLCCLTPAGKPAVEISFK